MVRPRTTAFTTWRSRDLSLDIMEPRGISVQWLPVMPYQNHLALIEPANRAARLWRYMSFASFLSVLDRSALFFPSVATLAAGDQYEGEPPLTRIRAARSKGLDEPRRFRLECEVFAHLNFFNCWHMNDGESDAMWKVYLKASEGVAIQSTVAHLMGCFRKTPDIVYMGKVQYIDHTKFDPPPAPLGRYTDYMFKRLAFQHEQEVRVGTFRNEVHMEFFDEHSGFLRTPAPGVIAENILRYPERAGVYVDIDAAELIDKVVVSPFSPDWFSELVVSVCRKIDYSFEVIPSEMLRPSALWLL
jgi:hypothetical protein